MGHTVENLFARLKDWRRIATRYDRCASIFRSAVLLRATVVFRLWVLTPKPHTMGMADFKAVSHPLLQSPWQNLSLVLMLLPVVAVFYQ